MNLTTRASFYVSLWITFIRHGILKEAVKEFEIRGAQFEKLEPSPLHIHFYVPQKSAGAQFIVWESIGQALEQIEFRAGAKITISTSIPSEPVDVLFCFKMERPRYIPSEICCLIICDEADRLWNALGDFDLVVVTSSLELCELVHIKNQQVFFLPEVEPLELIEFGITNCRSNPGEKNDILWHGGIHTLHELRQFKPFFVALRHRIGFARLLLVVGDGTCPPEFQEDWISVLPWSRDNLCKASQSSRLSILPARGSLKLSFLKPAARVRCCLAMGLVALGDRRVPEVQRLCSHLGLPSIDFSDYGTAVQTISDFWDKSDAIRNKAQAGHKAVFRDYSPEIAVRHWANLIFHLRSRISRSRAS